MPTAAFVSEHLGLQGLGVESANRFTDKYLIRTLTKDLGVTPIEWARVQDLEEALVALFNMSFPLVVKPLDSQDSRGVFKVSDEAS